VTPSPADPEGRVRKAAVVVADKLRRRIVTGEVPVGGSLPAESRLLEELGVSRPTLRAALRILESEELITVRRGSRGGAWVNAPTAQALAGRAGVYMQYHGISLEELYRAQAVIEPPAVRIVAGRAHPADAARLDALLEEEAAVVGDRTVFRASALRFHRALVELSGNEMLIVFGAMIYGVIEAHRDRHQMPGPAKYRSGAERHTEHRRLVELVREGKAEEAAGLWTDHLAAARPGLLRDSGPSALIDLLR
jgi:DNA-binding FadR family transcriptional regulator